MKGDSRLFPAAASSDAQALAAIIFAGVLLRVVWAALVPVDVVSDSEAYDTFARMLVSHGVYGWTPDEPSAYWPVGTSAIIAATYWLLGDTYVGVIGLNILSSALAMYFVFRLGELYFGASAGLWASAIIAFWPNLIMFTSILSSELYFIAFTIMGLYFWEKERGVAWQNWAISAVCWASACYVRPVILLLPFALILAAVPRGWAPSVRASLKAVAVTLVILLLLSPWSYRNYLVFGEPVLVSTNFGPNLWMGNNPETTGHYMNLPDYVHGMSEAERARALGEDAKQFILEHPAEFVRRTLIKAVKLHDRETIGVAWNQKSIAERFGPLASAALKIMASCYWYLALGAALCGAALLYYRDGLTGLVHPTLVAWSYFTALHAVIVVGDRYHMPSVPFIAILGGLALACLAERVRPRSATLASGS